VIVLLIGVAFAVVCNLGSRTGRENVERILNAAENGK
jgi:hypothetical protein